MKDDCKYSFSNKLQKLQVSNRSQIAYEGQKLGHYQKYKQQTTVNTILSLTSLYGYFLMYVHAHIREEE